MSHILKCPKCQKTYPVQDEAELTGKNYCSDCEVELIVAQESPPHQSSPLGGEGRVMRGDSPINSPHYLNDAPQDVQAAFKAKPLQIANKYIIVRKLGQGGMGAVYQGWDTSLRRYVALKVILSSKDDPSIKEDALKRFIREAQTAAKLAHPNILQVYEVGPYKTSYFICMEYVDGGTLDDYCERRHKTSKRPLKQDITEYLQMMRRVAEGIDYAHSQNIIHRDIKPENVLLSRHSCESRNPSRPGGTPEFTPLDSRFHGNDKRGGNDTKGGNDINNIIPKVADFGLAKDVMSEKKLTMAGTVVGTPLYMSPEQAMAHKLDTRSDIFSLGSVLYKLCTGVEPFMGKSSLDVMKAVVNKEPIPPSRLNRAIDHDLEVLILKAMAKEKERRYQTARELADDIERYLKGETIRARPASVIYKITKTIKRNKVAFAGAGIGAVLLLVLIVVIIGIYEKGSAENLTARDYLEEADEYYSKKDYDKAKEAYTKYLTLVKADEDAEDKLRQCDKKISDKEKAEKQAYDEAQNAWLCAAQILPEFYKPKTDMDRVWEQIDKAIRMLTDSLTKHPNPTGYFYRGLLYREKSETEKAIKDFTSAIEQDKDLMMAYVLRGMVYMEKYQDSIMAVLVKQMVLYEYLLQTARKDFDAIQDIKTDKYARITEQFRKYTKLFEALTWLKKDTQKCIKLLEDGYREYKAEEFLYWLGVNQFLNNDIAKAEKYLGEALEIKPQYAEVFGMMGDIKSKKNDSDGALKDYTQALRINPRLPIVYSQRGFAKYKKNDLVGAIDDFNTAIKINPDYARAYNNRGNAKRKMGDLDGALTDYDTVIKLDPNLAEPYYNRGNVKYAKEDWAGAIDDYNKYLTMSPDDADGYHNRGEAKFYSGDMTGAIDDYSSAIRLNPKMANSYMSRGSVKADRGDWSGALADYDAAIKLEPELQKQLQPFIDLIKRKMKK